MKTLLAGIVMILAVCCVWLSTATQAEAIQQSPTEAMLVKRVAKLERQMKEVRYQSRLAVNSSVDALAVAGQAKINVGQLESELGCIEQLPVVSENSTGALVPALPSDLITYRVAVISNKCRGWIETRR